ncbi:hypothetical protein QF050_003084 [Arthrobacter sp. SLBN-112]|nr:hypothetical protein [Arthrobacter sp. SLBN-112]
MSSHRVRTTQLREIGAGKHIESAAMELKAPEVLDDGPTYA